VRGSNRQQPPPTD